MPEKRRVVWISEIISGPEQHTWEKPDPEHTFRGRLDGTRARADEVVYEDDDVFAFRHNVDRSKEEWWEIHVVIIPKKWIPTILDFGLGDAKIWHHLIAGIQKVALTLGLYDQGFMIRMGVLPPYSTPRTSTSISSPANTLRPSSMGRCRMPAHSRPPSLLNVALTFATISSTAFGGGQKASVREQVLSRGWMDRERFIDGLEIAQVLPGPNILNLAFIAGKGCAAFRERPPHF